MQVCLKCYSSCFQIECYCKNKLVYTNQNSPHFPKQMIYYTMKVIPTAWGACPIHSYTELECEMSDGDLPWWLGWQYQQLPHKDINGLNNGPHITSCSNKSQANTTQHPQ